MVTLFVALHPPEVPLASVITTLYVPAAKPLISSVVAVKLPGPVHAKVYGVVPPAGVKLIEPVAPPLHNTFT